MHNNYFHSVILKPERCIGCTNCLKVCPTEAIRLIDGKANIIPERCIDCGECIRICPNKAKNAIADDINILKKYKYNVALTIPLLYGQFKKIYSPNNVLSAIKSLGFDEACDTSIGIEIANVLKNHIINNSNIKPLINSSCPAILRLIQVRFPELIKNILDIETPVEITARLIKDSIIKKTRLDYKDIGITLITPCTARVTSIRKPIGIKYSYIDNSISLKDIYGSILHSLSSKINDNVTEFMPTQNGILSYICENQVTGIDNSNTMFVDGIQNAISILEEIEIGRLNDLSYIEIAACPGGCLGGPLAIENRFIASNNLKRLASSCVKFSPSKEDMNNYINMYNTNAIRFTEKIEPRAVMKLDDDIKKSMEKMDLIQDILNDLPGINCGICGSPTCYAFAEDVVKGKRKDSICPVQKLKMNK